MKKLISMLLAVIMICSVMTVPAFATSDFVYGSSSEYGMEYGESGGMVGVIRKTDEFGKTIYVHGSPLNNKVFALVNAPAMDYTKTIGSVTFSNYIKHNTKTLNGRDENGNRTQLNVTQVYVGIGASMRSEVDRVEFMLSPSGVFNAMNRGLLEGYGVTSDLSLIKTNTPAYVADTGTPFYKYIDYFSVRPYTNLGRNYDGTWQKGLTWVFEEHTKTTDTEGGAGWGYTGDPNQYRKIYSIRVETPNGTEYYQVIVTNEGDFGGQKVETPVEPPKPETPTVEMPTLKSFDDVDPTRWSHNAIMICVEKGAISGTRTPDANGVGSFNPTGKVTLGQFLAVITRLVCPDAIKDTEGHWALKNYNAAVESGIIKSTDFNSTADALNATLSREDMAFIMVGAAKVNGEDLKVIDGIESIITDYNSISGSRKDAVLKCYSNGLIAGYTDGSFGYADTMTREQMATVVCRLMKYAPRDEVKFEEEKAPIVQNSDYFYTDGMVKTETQIAVVKDNFNNVRLYKNAKGELCVDVSAVSLPKALSDAGWELSVTVAPLDISGAPMDIDSSWYFKSGESVSGHVVKLYGDTVGIKVSDFSKVTVGMNLYHDDYTEAEAKLFFMSISDVTNVITGFYRNSSGLKNENINMDVSGIYKGLK